MTKKKFPRDNSKVISFYEEAPLCQILRRPKKPSLTGDESESAPETSSKEPDTDTLRVPFEVLDALSESSEVSLKEPSSESSAAKGVQHPLVAKTYPIPLEASSGVIPTSKALSKIQFPAAFLQYLGAHGDWQFIKGDATTSLWSFQDGSKYMVMSLGKKDPSGHYIKALSECEQRPPGAVFLDLCLVTTLF